MSDELFTVEEAAKFLRHRPSTIRDWILHRKIPFVKCSRRVLLRRSDLDALITASLVAANSDRSGDRSGDQLKST